jgi:GT2 family glycosyltransferase
MRPQRSLRAAVFAHNNDYGFEAASPPPILHAPSVACVIPYFETGRLALEVVAALVVSLRDYRHSAGASAPDCRLIVVDDGSRRRPFEALDQLEGISIQILSLENNQGRSRARNEGLRAAGRLGAEVTVFVDSDVLIPPGHIRNVVRAMQPPGHAIAASLFMTVRSMEPTVLAQALATARIDNDWRSDCVYQPSWIGCAPDLAFVGRRFRLLHESRNWRDWSGMIGPWCLANMVLGGCFGVPTDLAMCVGGFDTSFDGYGFTETTLVAKLIAAGCSVVPQMSSAAVHVEPQPSHLPQSERNVRFGDAHRRFFGEFLAREA